MKERVFEAIWYWKEKGIKLERGLVIKFGRIQYKVTDISTDDNNWRAEDQRIAWSLRHSGRV